MDYVFTPRALQSCMALAVSDDWFTAPTVPNDGSWQVLSIARPQCYFVFHGEDDASSTRIVLLDNGSGIFGDLPTDARRVAAQRVHRAALEAQRPPMHLPKDWKEYHADNLAAFFAAPLHYGNYRWIMEVERQGGAWTICFWKVTTQTEVVQLQNFHPDRGRLARILSQWGDAHAEASKQFIALPVPAMTESLQSTVDLDAVSHGAVTQYRSYDDWLAVLLTESQKQFVQSPTDHSAKVRGPAGSGKTLVLELKLLHELYGAREHGKNVKILFATHSWAMADQVDEALHRLDRTGDLSGVDVLPLIAIAQDNLPKERSGQGFQLLGEDSLSGKQLQLEKISEVIARLRRGDWLTFRDRTSETFRERVEASENSDEHRALVWDLMNEFASVLSANGILPGINAERRYLAIPRMSWMMPLANDADKRFVLRVYSDYVAALKADGVLTTDQLINDYHNYLETFVWNLRRGTEGYDLIFVDELHLFGEQERLVLHYLTRSADEYPKLFMALDPRQSANEIYAKFAVDSVSSGISGEADTALGNVEPIDLRVVHRFSPEILRLVRHVNRSYPALDLGSDWELDLDGVQSAVNHGAVPLLSHHRTIADEIASVLVDAKSCAAAGTGDHRTAIVLLDPMLLDTYAAAAEEAGIRVAVIRGRDDFDDLRYVKKSIVLSAAEYVGGLQFQAVVCAGFVDTSAGRANLGYRLRRFLSLLYLAVSRSSRIVHLHVNDEFGSVPAVLASALKAGIVTRGTG